MKTTLSLRNLMAVIVIICATLPVMADGLGVPFFRNYSSTAYNAHNRNYDVVCDDYGTVFVANFEGLLYYNGHTWRKIYTPGISRVTRVARDGKGRIWMGGYNVLGYITANDNGTLKLNTIVSDKSDNHLGEVDLLKIINDKVFVHTTSGKSYFVENDKKLVPAKRNGEILAQLAADSLARIITPTKALVTHTTGTGINIKTSNGSSYMLSENDGLISNAINFLTFDKRQKVWGATERGLFAIDMATPYSLVDQNQGLDGEVLSINQINNVTYIGTMNGLFVQVGNIVKPIKKIDLACWQLATSVPGELLAATSKGLYRIHRQGISRITDTNTFSVCTIGGNANIATGEIDGIYLVAKNGQRTRIAEIEKVTKISHSKGVLKAETIFGELWTIDISTKATKCIRKTADTKAPKLRYIDSFNTEWTTDPTGHNLTVKTGKAYKDIFNSWLYPLRSRSINTIYVNRNGSVWAGGDFGVIIFDGLALKHLRMEDVERPYIREITAMHDSIMWGGFDTNGLRPLHYIEKIVLPAGCDRIQIAFSTRSNLIICPTKYRVRINGGAWSKWSGETTWIDNSLTPGNLIFEVQAKDAYGRESEISTVNIYINWPFFLKWWMILIYIALLIWAGFMFTKWRTKRLLAEKAKLEAVVSERTSELSAAYEEQRKTSAELSETLIDLKRTQKDLVRMERTATAGKLTQGLIDRILNPINYINNFSRLTTGLAKDLKEDIDDEKENMSEDNFEDCEDILDMMTQNLQKIEEHGVNTTRTLRAMEAMLNNSVGNLVEQDLVPMCKQIMAVAKASYQKDIEQYGISLQAELPDHPILADIDLESMTRVIMSLVANSIYAIVRKNKAASYSGKLTIRLHKADGTAMITVLDNGIGIEDTIKEKVYDPFFTTKPTSDAAGVGLYLVRELVHDHNGNIAMNSVKNEYCEFIITIPCH